MHAYIGAKIIKAEPMSDVDFRVKYKNGESLKDDELAADGYHVVYPGTLPGEQDYHSWSPSHVFENAYRPVTLGEKAAIATTPDVSPEQIVPQQEQAECCGEEVSDGQPEN